MNASDRAAPIENPGVKKPSEEFAAFCEAEFERRLNSGEMFDEALYRKAMTMVLDRLLQREEDESR
jgi:hypothetical protein